MEDIEAASLKCIFTGKQRSTWESPDFWRKICPDLSISEIPSDSHHLSMAKDELERRQERLTDDGYVLIDDVTGDQQLLDKLAMSISILHKKHSLPATFALLYDETWLVARAASETLSSSTHRDNKFNFDVLAWYIDPREGVAGFSPHRDRQPDDAKSSFHENGMAKYVTMWLALTDASPENSCLYVIPKQFDPGYVDGDDDGGDGGSDPLSRALPAKQAYQNIRALPRNKGQSLLFTHRVLHWGSRGNPNSHIKTPRIAISFVSSDPDFEKAYLANSTLLENSVPQFKLRLLLVCAQLLIYYQRFDLPKECIKACHDYVKEHEEALEETYRKKVYVEFISAMREEQDQAKGEDEFGSDGHDDDDDDAVLEAMLDAEAGGYGEFEDDFDKTEGNEPGEGESDGGEEEEIDDDEETGISFGNRERDEDTKEERAAKKLKN